MILLPYHSVYLLLLPAAVRAECSLLCCSDVQAKHQAIQNLEVRINEIAEMFSDLALLVEQQGEKLDRIEDNVAK